MDKVTLGEEQGTDGCEDEWDQMLLADYHLLQTEDSKKKDDTNSIYAVGGLREIDDEVATHEEMGGRETESGMSWSYFVICLNVLIGLIGGRAFALFLTLSWFLV